MSKITPCLWFDGEAESPESMNTGLWNMDSGFTAFAAPRNQLGACASER